MALRLETNTLHGIGEESSNVYRDSESDTAQHRDRLVAASPLVRREHVGAPLDTCMMDVRFREKFQDALAVVISDQERAGLDLLTHGDYHCDEDMAGRAWHHYPLQRWAGFEGDYLQPDATRAPWLLYPSGTLLNEIYTGWRWPDVVDTIEHRPLGYPKIWRIAQGKSTKPVRFGTCCSQVMALFLDIHTKNTRTSAR